MVCFELIFICFLLTCMFPSGLWPLEQYSLTWHIIGSIWNELCITSLITCIYPSGLWTLEIYLLTGHIIGSIRNKLCIISIWIGVVSSTMDISALGNSKITFHYFLYKVPGTKSVFLLFSLCRRYSVIFLWQTKVIFPRANNKYY